MSNAFSMPDVQARSLARVATCGLSAVRELRGDADMAIVMQALLWQIAGSQKCVARERLVVGPDAYLALDLPDRE